jgi:hypothetical protein
VVCLEAPERQVRRIESEVGNGPGRGIALGAPSVGYAASPCRFAALEDGRGDAPRSGAVHLHRQCGELRKHLIRKTVENLLRTYLSYVGWG